MSRARVCIVRQRAYYELPVRREAEALRDAGFDVDVICLRGPDEPAFEVDAGVRLHRLPLRRRRGGVVGYAVDYLGFLVVAGAKLTRLHLTRRFAVVQVNTMPDFLVFCTLIPRLTGAKVVAFMKEPTPELGVTLYRSRWVGRLLAVIEQLVLRYAHLAFTVTERLKAVYVARGAEPDKIRVVLNGPDARHLEDARRSVPDESAVFRLICHGSVEERYGHDTILEAIHLLRDRLPQLRLTITGTGDYEATVRRMIRELDLEELVTYRGWVSMEEVLDELGRADVGIVAQKASPYSNLVHTNKMYEYMILGIPVVASSLEATAETFDEDTVRYFEAGDAHSLAAAIAELYEHPAERERFARNASRRYAECSWEAQRRVFLDGYRDLLAS